MWSVAPRWSITCILQGRARLARRLFLAETVQPHDFGTLAGFLRFVLALVLALIRALGLGRGQRRSGGARGKLSGRFASGGWLGCGIGRFELQTELHGR